jgi:cytochrome c5
MRVKYIFIAAVLFIAACSTTQHLRPEEADLAVAQQRIPGITISELQSGYKIYATNCSGCHRLHSPREYTAEKWKPILSEMFAKAKMTDDKQKELVANYLVAKAK